MSIINNLTGEVIREESEIEQQDAYLDSMIKKHSLIVQRLKTIKKMESILRGESKEHVKYMGDNTFVNGVKYRLKAEQELLDDLLLQ